MEQELKRKTTVIGHRNPDTDSICSAICYANLKRAITGDAYIPARAGHVNGETRFVLDYFGMEEPKLVEDQGTIFGPSLVSIYFQSFVRTDKVWSDACSITQGRSLLSVPNKVPR